MTWKLRNLRSEDSDGLVHAIDAVCGASGWMSTTRFVPTGAWQHALDRPGDGDHLLLVVEAEGQVVGWCRLFSTVDEAAGRRGYQKGELGIGLLSAYRGQGIGGALVEHALRWAAASGLQAVNLTTHRDNHRAVRLFSSQGFQAVGRETDGQIVMERRLEGAYETGQMCGGE